MIYLFLAVGLPILFSAIVVFAPWRDPVPLAAFLAMTISGGAYSFFSASWSVFSYWAMAAMALSVLAASLVGAAKLARAEWRRPRALAIAGLLVFSAAAVYFSLFVAGAVRAMQAPDDRVALAFPFRDGVFSITQGGSSTPLQSAFGHMSAPSQRYALDVVRLNRAGHAGEAYLSFGSGDATADEPVYAPCAGDVVWARDGLPDTPNVDRERPAGNVVAIACQGVIVYLAHMARGSLEVSEGDRVEAGAPIGRIGISGSSTIHHLHFHAERGPFRGDFSDNPGVAMTFDGAYGWRNRLFVR